MNFETFKKRNVDRCNTVAQSCKNTLKELEDILSQQDVLVDTITKIYSQNTKILTRVIDEVKESVIGIEAIANSLRSAEFTDPAFKNEYDKLYEKIAGLMATLNGTVPPRFVGSSETGEEEDLGITVNIPDGTSIDISIPGEKPSVDTSIPEETPSADTSISEEAPSIETSVPEETTTAEDDFSDADIDAMFCIEEETIPSQQANPTPVTESENSYKDNNESSEASNKLKTLFNRANKLNF